MGARIRSRGSWILRPWGEAEVTFQDDGLIVPELGPEKRRV